MLNSLLSCRFFCLESYPDDRNIRLTWNRSFTRNLNLIELTTLVLNQRMNLRVKDTPKNFRNHQEQKKEFFKHGWENHYRKWTNYSIYPQSKSWIQCEDHINWSTNLDISRWGHQSLWQKGLSIRKEWDIRTLTLIFYP